MLTTVRNILGFIQTFKGINKRKSGIQLRIPDYYGGAGGI